MTATAAPTAPTVDAVKSFKGGWKDAGLRAAGSRVSLSQPLVRQFVSSHWDRPRRIHTVDADGHMLSPSGEFAFECCRRCGRWSGETFRIDADGVKTRTVQGSRPRCACPRPGAKLLDVEAVALPELGIGGIALSVLVRAGIETTHDAAELGFLALYELPGVGAKSVDALRAAINAAELPELCA